MPNGEPPCLRSELGGLGSDMGEKVDFHLPVEDKDEEEEASLPVLFPLLLPDFLTLEGKKKTHLNQSKKRFKQKPLRKFLPLSFSPSLPGPSLLSKDIVAIFLSILLKKKKKI